MIKKFIELVRENRRNQKEIIRYAKELNWANVYHDSIRGKDWLEKLPLNVGRWGCNYAFFYVLNRILTDYAPKNILEMGLGESSKFVSSFLDKELLETKHLVIEQDEKFKSSFINNNKIHSKTVIQICPIKIGENKGYQTITYQNFDKIVNEKFDLYMVDGPTGSRNYSRFDLVKIAESLGPEDEFIIIVDDYQRIGERETVKCMTDIFKKNGIQFYELGFSGVKEILVVVTEKYKGVSTF